MHYSRCILLHSTLVDSADQFRLCIHDDLAFLCLIMLRTLACHFVGFFGHLFLERSFDLFLLWLLYENLRSLDNIRQNVRVLMSDIDRLALVVSAQQRLMM